MPREKSYIYPTVLVFKTSERSNARIKMKIFNNKNIDEVLDEDINLSGVPENAIILDVGLGQSWIDKYKVKYKL